MPQQNDINHSGVLGMRWGKRKTTDITKMNEKQKMKAFGKEKVELHREINRKALIDKETISEEAGKRYYKKNANKKDYNPDDWDFKYEDRELKKLNEQTSKAHADVNSFLEKKYNVKMSDFNNAEKARIANGEKVINVVGASIMAASVAGLVYAAKNMNK